MTDTSPTLYCYNHPQVETSLRCNNCDRPICPRCAKRMATGYRCPECVKGQQKAFDTSEWYDYPLVFAVVSLLSYFGSTLVQYVGFFAIFLAPVAGMVLGEAARLVLRRHRSKRLFQVAAAAAFIGALPLILANLLSFNLFSLIWLGYYAFAVTSAVYYRLGGISIGR